MLDELMRLCSWSASASHLRRRRRLLPALHLSSCLLLGIGSATAQCSPQWLLSEGFDVGSTNGGSFGPAVKALLTRADGHLIAGGAFGQIGRTSARNLASWDGSNWSPLAPTPSDQITMVLALAELPNGDVVAGGIFTSTGGVQFNHIARWTGTSWVVMGSGTNNWVNALVVMPNGDLVAGGSFTTAGGIAANCIARWNGTSWAPMGTGLNNAVYALTVWNGDLVAGGDFNMAGGVPANRVARWSEATQTWWALGAGVTGNNSFGDPPSVRALCVFQGDVVAGGTFTTAGGVGRPNIARWNGTTWSSLGSGLGPGLSLSRVHALLTMSNGDLVAGGHFNYTLTDWAYVARWNGTTWAALSAATVNAPAGFVNALTSLPDGTLVVGAESSLGSGGSAVALARWGCANDQATASRFGSGCSNAESFFQQFASDPQYPFPLSHSSIRMTLTGTGYLVTQTAGAPAFHVPTSPDLGLGDEAVTAPIALPFSLPYPGGVTNQIVIGSNGFVFMQPDTDPTAVGFGFHNLTARHAPLCTNLDPLAGTGSGTVHFDVDAGGQIVYATWSGVQQLWAPTEVNTFQVAMSANGDVEYRYLGCSTNAWMTLVGWTPGGGASWDMHYLGGLNAMFETSSVLPHSFAIEHWATRPGLGTSCTLNSIGIPPNSLLAVHTMSLAQLFPGVSLAPIGMPRCYQFAAPDVIAVFLPNNGMGSTTFAIPVHPAYVGVHVFTQGYALVPGVNPIGAQTTNGVDLRVGWM